MLKCGMEVFLTGYSVQRIMNQEQMTKDILRQLKIFQPAWEAAGGTDVQGWRSGYRCSAGK